MPKNVEGIIMSGVIPVIYSPSESLLTVSIDVTDLFNSQAYMDWKETIEDMLYELDRKYAVKKERIKGRKISASYKTVVTPKGKRRIRVIEVAPYPSRFLTILSYIRTRIYGSTQYEGILPKYGVVITEVQRGPEMVKLYLIPSSNIKKFNDEIDKLNTLIDDLQEAILKYEQSEDFQNIIGALKIIPEQRWSKHPVKVELPHVRVKQIPFAVSHEIIESYMDERTRREVEATVAAAVQRVAQDIQNKIKMILEEYWSAISKKYSERSLNKIRMLTENLKQLPEAMKWYSQEISALEAMVEAMKSDDPDKVYNAITNMAKALKIRNPETMKTEDLIKQIDFTLTEGLSTEVLALVNSL